MFPTNLHRRRAVHASRQRPLSIEGKVVEVTPAEYVVAETLMASVTYVARDRLLAVLPIGVSNALSRTIDVHVARLRRKLAAAGLDVRILSSRGHGYRWTVEKDDAALGERSKGAAIEVDADGHFVLREGSRVPLTAHEVRLLSLLVGRRGEPVSRVELHQALELPMAGRKTRCMDVHISRIRTKLGDAARKTPLIRTVRGIGWLIDW
jgi:DNA-binding response OmpR family regulator